ncbi:MAG: hypothetical protein K0S42_1753, partial [Microvirga sp.]|nr:hypothetical protein [Microvirga sp.]
WHSFCLWAQFTGRRLEDKPEDRCQASPEITKMELGYGSVTVKWTDPENYDRFEVAFEQTGRGKTTRQTENLEFKFAKLQAGGCWAQVRGIHEHHGWTGFPGCASPWSAIKETSLPPELGYSEAKFAPGTPLGAVTRNPSHHEIFACLPDGKPVGIWSDGWWQEWYGHGTGPGAGFPAGAPLTSISRADGFMDLFGVANDGRVYLGWWSKNPWNEWYMLSDSVFPPGAFIAAISRHDDQMDVFAIGSDGVVRSSWWNGDPWREWFSLAGASFPPGAFISAITRNPDQMDIFATGSDGVVRSNWWNGNPWRGWFDLPGVGFPPGAPVAAITRHQDQMDLFAVGNDGVMYNNWWNGNPWRGWQKLEGAIFPPDAFISAIPNGPNRQFVLAVGTDGNVYFNIFSGSWGGWQKVSVNLASAPSFIPGQHIAPNFPYLVAKDGFVRWVNLSYQSPVANKLDM